MCNYKVRCFYSKGAFLVLVWTFFVSFANCSIPFTLRSYNEACSIVTPLPEWIFAFLAVIGMLGGVFCGWLADAKLGNYRVMKFSIILLFILSLCTSIFTLVPCTLLSSHVILFMVIGSIYIIAYLVLLIAFITTSFQQGLDQMPDASSTSVTSFIAWFVFCIDAASWINEIRENLKLYCWHNVIWHIELYSLVPPVCMSIVLVLDFLLVKRWFIIEPTTPQSFKTVYRVLKFAAKHKSPLNRSAFTFWEKDIPSRIDLGKSRYGGPFTTGQVEDVKTILRLIPLCLTLFLLAGTLVIFCPLTKAVLTFQGWTICNDRLFKVFIYNTSLCGMLWTGVYEFVVYPLLRKKFPNILKRIGIISFLITVFSFLFLTLEVVLYYDSNVGTINTVIILLKSLSKGVLSTLLVNAMLELICAQAPYNMRGMFGGWMAFILGFSELLQHVYPFNVSLIAFGVNAGLSFLGFIVFCILARWYKMRVRDEEYCTQAVVEEVYDRYLSAR